MNTTLLIAFFVVFVTSGVFSMFGKGGGSLYTPVLVMLGMVVSTPAAAVPGRADLLYKSALLVSSPVALRRLERADATTLFRLARCKPCHFMKRLAQLLSALALPGTLLPPLLFFADPLDLAAAQRWLLGATLLWIVATPFWMEHRASSCFAAAF